MKKFPLFLASTAICMVGLSACQKTPSPNTDTSAAVPSEIGFILYTGENRTPQMTVEELQALETTAAPVHWNLTDGTVTIQEEPMMTIQGSSHYDAIASWDGAHNVVLNSIYTVTDQNPDFNYVGYRMPKNTFLVQGHGYQIELTPEGACIFTKTSASESKTFPIAQALADANVSFSDLSYLKSDFDGTNLRVAFKICEPDIKVIYVTVDVENNTVDWSSPVAIPEEYAAGFWKADPCAGDVVFAANRLYFSGWDTIAYLDLNTNRISTLKAITDQLDALFPDAERTNSGIVEDTNPVGCSAELAIFGMTYYEKNSSDEHRLYYVVHGDQLVGAMSLNFMKDGSTITTYNNKLELIQTINVSHLQLKSIPLEFQSRSYP